MIDNAPVESSEAYSDNFYSLLKDVIDKVNRSDHLLIQDDFNARVSNLKIKSIVRIHGEEFINQNGVKLVDLELTTIIFKHEDCQLETQDR